MLLRLNCRFIIIIITIIAIIIIAIFYCLPYYEPERSGIIGAQ